MAKKPSTWVTALIDQKNLHTLFEDMLGKRKYQLVEVYIPTIKVLKKQIKNKKYFEEVPLMMNYGFFKVPNYFIPNSHFLVEMKKDLRCIYDWLIDPIAIKKESKHLKYRNNPLGVAIVSDLGINLIKKQQERYTIYTEKEIDTLYESQNIILQCYPYEGLPAKILTIDKAKRKVKVQLLLDAGLLRKTMVWVEFENIFFTKYMDDYIDKPMKEVSLEEMEFKNKGSNNKTVRDEFND